MNAGDTIVTLDSSALSDELTTAQDTYSLEETKTNKTVADAKDSIADAQDAYTEGSKEQTKKAKQAYEELKEQKSALQKALKTAKKENEKAQ